MIKNLKVILSTTIILFLDVVTYNIYWIFPHYELLK